MSEIQAIACCRAAQHVRTLGATETERKKLRHPRLRVPKLKCVGVFVMEAVFSLSIGSGLYD